MHFFITELVGFVLWVESYVNIVGESKDCGRFYEGKRKAVQNEVKVDVGFAFIWC